MGYPYEAAMRLPSWLFWQLVTSSAKQDVRQQQAITQAVAMGFGGYKEATVREIQDGWRKVLTLGHPERPSSDVYSGKATPPKMDAKRRALWTQMGGAFKVGASNKRH